ncbi:small integral membrane protein 12 isoform X1 [Dipodomys merriami]
MMTSCNLFCIGSGARVKANEGSLEAAEALTTTTMGLHNTWILPKSIRNREGRVILDVMWPVFWTMVRTYAPYVTFPVAFVVGAVGYHLEWFIRGKDPQPVEEEKSISERREDRKLDELLGKDHTQVVSLKDKLEFAPKAVLNRNRPEKN